ncbi:MAG TPA: CHRD domain-containing protein [Candidatus Acidoferrum sp.]|nr:CHRD domain-containing protein [Candidatus Acidoferrum sp.]
MARIVAAAFAAVLLIACAAPAYAERIRLSANLDGVSEVPPVQSPATATATVWFDKDTGMVTWDVYWSGLSGPPTAAHFHGPASKTNKAGVQLDLGGNGFHSPFRGSAALTEGQADQLLSGKWYINIHTAAHPDGEIRGQVLRQP